MDAWCSPAFPFWRELYALAVSTPRRPALMLVRIPFDHSAPMQIADELDHLVARANAFGERIRDAEKHGADLCAGHIALVERVGDRSQPTCLRQHVDGQAVMHTDLFGEFLAIAQVPLVL